MKEYRIQEYVFGMGVFHRHSIHTMSFDEYDKTYRSSRRFIILSEDDPYAESLPDTIWTEEKLAELCRIQEAECIKREFPA